MSDASAQLLVVLPVDDEARRILLAVPHVVGSLGDAPNATALVCGPTDRVGDRELDAMPSLRLISVAGSGTDAVDARAAAKRGIAVMSCPEVLAAATADVAIGLLISAARGFVAGDRLVREGRWPGWSFFGDLGVDVAGTTLGIVGFGAVGRQVAARASSLGMHIVHHTRRPTGEPGWMSDLDSLLSTAQHVSLHVPLTAETQGLINAHRLRLLTPSSVLVNTARGAIVDEEALADALDAGTIFAAGLDVYDGEPIVNPRLLDSRRTTLLPHIGSATRVVRSSMLCRAIRNAIGVAASS
jgi:glyoxylate reductase